MNVHSNLSYSSPKVETSQISINDEWIRNVVYPYNRILFCNKEKRSAGACYIIGETLKTSYLVKEASSNKGLHSV